MHEPLNPYERYELTGMTDAELEREMVEREERYWDSFPDWEDDSNDKENFDRELDELFEEVFDNGEF